MSGLTPSERRGARVLAIVLAIGTLSDLHRARAPDRAPPPERFAVAPQATDSTPAAATPPGHPGLPPQAGRAGAPTARPLDLDSASVADLDALPGIGPVLAARIVEQRRLHGRFRHVDELLLVPGIGPRLLERLRPWLREPTH
jgi:competence protein ComEA